MATEASPARPSTDDALAAWRAIAPSFAAARQEPWPLVAAWLASLPPGARVLDLGAGGGRHARAARALGHHVLAVDAAPGFMPQVQALAEALPVRDATFDAVLLVAVLGTMPRQADRVAALREARRALRPGGAMLVTAWARWQPKYVRALLGLGPWRRTGPGRVLAPWAQGSQRVERPYFLYTSRGLRADLGAAGWTGGRVRKVALAGKGPDNLVVEATAPRAPSNPS